MLSFLSPRQARRVAAATLVSLSMLTGPAVGQDLDLLQLPPVTPPPGGETAPPDRTTVVPRSPSDPGSGEQLAIKLVAQLTSDGQPIDQGLVWRIYEGVIEPGGKAQLITTERAASPTVSLRPGDYVINAAFGRAHLTRKVSVKSGAPSPLIEQFVLNAGGLRVVAVVGGAKAPANAVSYSIYSDRDQSDSRKLIVGGLKLGTVVRLNAGIYHVISKYGDANAEVRSDVTVEAGKLTETTIAHAAAKATFKLVARAGGEAVSDTMWTIQDGDGDEVKSSAGALPTHILAPGTYTVVARSRGKSFQREVTLTDGEVTQVEVVMK